MDITLLWVAPDLLEKALGIVGEYRGKTRADYIRPLAKKICVILKSLLKFRSNFELLG